MLLLLFELGSDRYGLDVRQVLEVIPLVQVKRVPHAPPGVAGLLNYRGAAVPVIDLTSLTVGRASHARLSTRIIIVQYADQQEPARLLGLIAERATATVRRADADFVAPAITPDGAPYLGPIVTDGRGLIQLVHPSMLLPPSVRDVLFRERGVEG